MLLVIKNLPVRSLDATQNNNMTPDEVAAWLDTRERQLRRTALRVTWKRIGWLFIAVLAAICLLTLAGCATKPKPLSVFYTADCYNGYTMISASYPYPPTALVLLPQFPTPPGKHTFWICHTNFAYDSSMCVLLKFPTAPCPTVVKELIATQPAADSNAIVKWFASGERSFILRGDHTNEITDAIIWGAAATVIHQGGSSPLHQAHSGEQL